MASPASSRADELASRALASAGVHGCHQDCHHWALSGAVRAVREGAGRHRRFAIAAIVSPARARRSCWAGAAPSQLPVHGVPADDLGFVRHDQLIQQRLLRAGGYSDDPADKKPLAQAKRCTGDAPLRGGTASSRQPLGGTPGHAHPLPYVGVTPQVSTNR